MIKYTVALLLSFALTVPAALYHGRVTERWSTNEILHWHASNLPNVPLQIGEWKLVNEGPQLTPRVQQELGVHAHFNRIYENDIGDRVTALVMVGEAGPLARHPVEICYGNRAKKLVHRYSLNFVNDGVQHHMNVRRYQPKSSLEDEFYVAYSFCADGVWKTPDLPRVTFGAKPVLYKVQVLTNAKQNPAHEYPNYLQAFCRQFCTAVWPDSDRVPKESRDQTATE